MAIPGGQTTFDGYNSTIVAQSSDNNFLQLTQVLFREHLL